MQENERNIKIIQNPNKDFANKIISALSKNNGYCPCSIIKNEDTKCMCKEFRNKIENKEIGMCHCGLYQIIENS